VEKQQSNLWDKNRTWCAWEESPTRIHMQIGICYIICQSYACSAWCVCV